MPVLRTILIVFFLIIASYTAIVLLDYGFTLFPIFITDILSLNWSGQFNLDFSLYLLLSGIWIAWRHQFSLGGIVMGLIAAILGMVVFAPYMLITTLKENGDLKKVLLGSQPY
ncbi:MAG: hypothetical protein AAGA18_15645 [Verrucomicrobiota bacterium]